MAEVTQSSMPPSTSGAGSTPAAPAKTYSSNVPQNLGKVTLPEPSKDATSAPESKVAPPASLSGEISAEAPVPTPFTPNFKVKVMDKEYEIPEFMQGVITDAETEKTIRELHEKAYGLDIVKPKLQEARQKIQERDAQIQAYDASIGELREIYQRKDFDSFFDKLKIPVEEVLQWVVDKVNYQELPPEQRHAVEARRTAERKAWEAEKRAQQLEGSMDERATAAKINEFKLALQLPDIKSYAESFDTARGEGAFQKAVGERGELAWYSRQEDISPIKAIQEVMALYGSMGSAQTPAPQAPQAAAAPVTPTPPAKAPPVIPNVSGRQATPMKGKPRSLDELKELYNTKFRVPSAHG